MAGSIPVKYPMTPASFEKLKEELKHLTKVERPRISQEIGIARELGDLSENAEYHAAKERQGMIEARIKDLEARTSLAEVIDPKKLSGDRVMFGATVTVTDLESDDEITYQIVGDDEADLKLGLVSISSPISRALIGKAAGDVAEVQAPGGVKHWEIIEVRYN